MAADESEVKRFLCSDLVILSVGGQRRLVNLEEIWLSGAVVDSEDELPAGEQAGGAASLIFDSQLEARKSQHTIGVTIRSAEKHEFGWRVELRFKGAEWTPDLYRPAHLTDVEDIAVKSRAE